MSKPNPTDFFNKEAAQKYDERNSKLNAISNSLHFLTGLVLKDLPIQSRILCVGVGTGAEILSLAQIYPEWTFVGIEPAIDMLNVCRERIQKAGLSNRCELYPGFIQDLPQLPPFDAVLSILVAHFIKRADREEFFKYMSQNLKSGGILVNAEISFDLDSKEFPQMLKGWEQVQRLMGGTDESIATLQTQLRSMLNVLPPAETENFLKQSGIAIPVRFFQALMICGWFGRKD